MPYFDDKKFPSNMEAIWHRHFGYLASAGHTVIVGEWGGFYAGKDRVWQDEFAHYLQRNQLSSFYWCLNPNSGDTGCARAALCPRPDRALTSRVRACQGSARQRMGVAGEGEAAAPRQPASVSALAPSGSAAISLAVRATPVTATDATGAASTASIPTAVAAAAVSAARGTAAMVGGVRSECSARSRRRAGAGARGGPHRGAVLRRVPCALPVLPQPTPTPSGCQARA